MRKVVSYLTIGCNDLDQAVAFYDPVLAALGLGRVVLSDMDAAVMTIVSAVGDRLY